MVLVNHGMEYIWFVKVPSLAESADADQLDYSKFGFRFLYYGIEKPKVTEKFILLSYFS